MPYILWNARYIPPDERKRADNVRSDMRYGATREGVDRLDKDLRPRAMSGKEGLEYIARRRGAAAFEPDGDGLFNAEGKADLTAEVQQLQAHTDSVEWRFVLSFERQQLQERGYDDPKALQQLLAAKMPEIARLHHILPEHMVWNAAYHPVDKQGRNHHPHVHIYLYSTDPSEGLATREQTQSALEKGRSIFTHAVFSEQMEALRQQQKEARQLLRETAAHKGAISAEYPLGQLEEKAGNGREAIRHYEKAAQNKDLYAMYRLGRLYDRGKLVTADCALYEILEDRKNLEEQFHRPVRGLAYAWGTYSDTVVEMAKKAGVSYARTTGTSESFGIPEDWLRWHPTCHHAHPRLMEFAERMVAGSPLNDPYNHTPWLFYVWGHTYEFDAWGSWELIEKFARYIGNREDIWYATNGQVHDYVEAYRHLDWTLEGDAVYNPTALPVWFEAMEYSNYTFKTYCVQPGELLRLHK